MDWARDNKLDPRFVRRVARANKKEIATLQVKGAKYVFPDSSPNAVAKIINDGLTEED